jgi:hypothetical protein
VRHHASNVVTFGSGRQSAYVGYHVRGRLQVSRRACRILAPPAAGSRQGKPSLDTIIMLLVCFIARWQTNMMSNNKQRGAGSKHSPVELCCAQLKPLNFIRHAVETVGR